MTSRVNTSHSLTDFLSVRVMLYTPPFKNDLQILVLLTESLLILSMVSISSLTKTLLKAVSTLIDNELIKTDYIYIKTTIYILYRYSVVKFT